MTVIELFGLLDSAPGNARVLIFDHLKSDDETTRTIEANCILTMDHNGPVVIIANQDAEL